MLSGFNDCMKMLATISVSVDLTNAKEVELLREVLAAWPEPMKEVEIVLKVRSFYFIKLIHDHLICHFFLIFITFAFNYYISKGEVHICFIFLLLLLI